MLACVVAFKMSGLLSRELEKEFAELERRSTDSNNKKAKRKLSEQLPTTRHGIKKQMKRLKAENSRPKFGGPSKKMKFSFLELQSDAKAADVKKEKIEEGVKKLVGLSKAAKAIVKASTVVEHNEKLQRRYVPKSRLFKEQFSKKKPSSDVAGTVFTEEDFEKFSREYFINSKPIHPSTLVTKPKFNDD